MGIAERKIAEREVSTVIPLSIATGLAIESACGLHPEIVVDKAPVLTTKRLLVNLRTMIRNIHGSVETEIKKILTKEAVFLALNEELSILEGAINRASEGMCQVTFYYCDFRSLRRKFPNAAIKEFRSDLQNQYNRLEADVIEMLKAFGPSSDVRFWDTEFNGNFEDAFIITHHPVDLLWKSHFSKLTLLESHTGAFKSAPQWNTKLTNGKELDRIPFNRFSLQVFGDNGQLFSPLTRHTKDAVKDLAQAKLWTNVTTMDKIRYDIQYIEDTHVKQLLLSLL